MSESLFYKAAGLMLATLSKQRFWHRCFTVTFAKFLITPLLQKTSERLLLNLIPQSNHIYNTGKSDKVESFYCRADVFQNCFLHYVFDRGGLNKKEIQPSLYNIFSILIFNELNLFT